MYTAEKNPGLEADVTADVARAPVISESSFLGSLKRKDEICRRYRCGVDKTALRNSKPSSRQLGFVIRIVRCQSHWQATELSFEIGKAP